MEKEVKIKGWVIYTPKHSFCGSELWWDWSFRKTRSKCIADFVANSGETWRGWKRKYNYKCVKAESIIKILI